ncbi:MAG: type II toxin-antitoxin system ParD family antitoxin [Rhodospirillaceae bacterium]|nr:type II toxin-antitoxin system ParD family antitoxin [Rhodospirillaceae bacterium]
MAITLRKETEEYIRARVEKGGYESAEQFIEAAIFSYVDSNLSTEELLEEIPDLRAKIEEGLASGPGIPAEEVFAELYELQRELEEKAKR